MALPYTLTPAFTEAVDNLMRDAAIPDSTLHARSKQYLDVFDDTTAGPEVSVRPAWSERIRIPSESPLGHPFTTPALFNAMFEVTDELGFVAGKRYVSAAICVCGEQAARAHAAAPGAVMHHGALVRALHELSSTWAAFLLWPFHAYGNDDRFDANDDDCWSAPAAGDDTPTAASIARAQRHHIRKLVMARDDRRCFVSEGLDRSAYYEGMPGVTRVVYCTTVPIIPAELLPSESEANQDVMWGILRRFCGIQDPATLAQHVAQGPANTLLVNRWAGQAFHEFLWWLLPTETPDRYEIKNPDPVFDIGQGQPPPSHVTFADHSLRARAGASSSIDLPNRTLLRIHAALAEVLHRSGAINTFLILQQDFPSRPPRSRRGTVTAWSGSVSSYSYSASVGGAFWRSVVEYEGPEMCAEVELREAVRTLALGNSAGAVSRAVQ